MVLLTPEAAFGGGVGFEALSAHGFFAVHANPVVAGRNSTQSGIGVTHFLHLACNLGEAHVYQQIRERFIS